MKDASTHPSFWSQFLWIQAAQWERCAPQALGCKRGDPWFSHNSVTFLQWDFGSLLLRYCPSSEAWLPSLHITGSRLCACVRECCHVYELINHCPAESSFRETSPPAPPRRQSRWKIGASPHLGSGKKIFFFPLLSKNMPRPFLSLDAIKTSCGSEQPLQPLPREKENQNSHWRWGQWLCPGARPRSQPPPTWNWVSNGHGSVPVCLSWCGPREPGIT